MRVATAILLGLTKAQDRTGSSDVAGDSSFKKPEGFIGDYCNIDVPDYGCPPAYRCAYAGYGFYTNQ